MVVPLVDPSAAAPAYGSTGGTVIGDTAYNAFPGLTQRTNGDLVAAFRTGASHLSYDGVLVTRKSTDQGATWGSQATVASPASGYDYRDASLYVGSSGRWFLNTFDRNNSNGTIRVVLFTSDDEGVTWSSPNVLTTSFALVAATSGPVVELAGGTLLMPIYGSNSGGDDRCAVLFSSDDGATWGSQTTILDRTGAGFSVNECCLFVLPDDTVLAFIRQEGGTSGPLWRVASTDGGNTWGTAVQCATVYPGRPSVARFSTSVLLLSYRQAGTEKPVWAYSINGGLSWTEHSPAFTNAIGVYGCFWPLADGTMGMLQAAEGTSTAHVLYQQIAPGA